MSAPCVAIVDPYSSGAMLAGALHQRQVPCIGIHSSPRIPDRMRSRYDPKSFVTVIDHDGDIDETLASLHDVQLTHVVAGFETGVTLADELGALLSLPRNDLDLTEARRDKYLMIDTIARRGLRTPQQIESNRHETVLAWVDASVGWPVVVKPRRSVASDQVSRCCSAEELRHAMDAVLSCPTKIGERNESALAQEFLHGIEYVVDVVSYQGRRKTTAFWQYSRTTESGEEIGYDAMTLLPYEGERQRELQSYAFAVLDALGVVFGPAHCEIMWTHDGPVIVEVGSRMTAGNNAVLSRTCGGICQLDKTIEIIMAPQRFLESLNEVCVLTRWAMNVFLIPRRAGRLTALKGLDIIKRLGTLHSMSIGARPGKVLQRVAGVVTLLGDNMEAMERDARIIREVERAGLFEVVV